MVGYRIHLPVIESRYVFLQLTQFVAVFNCTTELHAALVFLLPTGLYAALLFVVPGHFESPRLGWRLQDDHKSLRFGGSRVTGR